MNCDFEIERGIDLVKDGNPIDLHNFYAFEALNYAVTKRSLELQWRRSSNAGVPMDLPQTVAIRFDDVTTFTFFPRNPDLPFSEDDCLSTFGNWDGEHGVVMHGGGEMHWDEPVGIALMSDATIVIKAASARATLGAT